MLTLLFARDCCILPNPAPKKYDVIAKKHPMTCLLFFVLGMDGAMHHIDISNGGNRPCLPNVFLQCHMFPASDNYLSIRAAARGEPIRASIQSTLFSVLTMCWVPALASQDQHEEMTQSNTKEFRETASWYEYNKATSIPFQASNEVSFPLSPESLSCCESKFTGHMVRAVIIEVSKSFGKFWGTGIGKWGICPVDFLLRPKC